LPILALIPGSDKRCMALAFWPTLTRAKALLLTLLHLVVTTAKHPFVERLIGTVRREFLDHVLFWNARDLERKLAEFQVYYNAARCHASLEGHTPLAFAGGHMAIPADLSHVCAGSPIAGTSSSSPVARIRDRHGETGPDLLFEPTRTRATN
jgi:hypothetical protein